MWEYLCDEINSTFEKVEEWMKDKNIQIRGLTLYKGKLSFRIYYKKGV
jgi:hypothetical protein